MLLKADLWTTLIDLFVKWLTNYGWTIVVFTICLKLVLIPVDIFQRISSGKQTRAMGALQPQLDEINKKYAGDSQKINEETNKLYKKYNVNLGGMCLSMLLTLGVSLLVFLTLFGSIRTYGTEKLVDSYRVLDSSYVQAQKTLDVENVKWDDMTHEQQTTVIAKVKETYNASKPSNSWLWVKNVWKADTNGSQFVDLNTYLNSVEKEQKEIVTNRYNAITSEIAKDEGGANGNFVLLIVTALVAFGSQFLTAKISAPKGQKINKVNWIMMAVLPLSMVLFAYNSNVVFTLYTIANSLMTAILSVIYSFIFKSRQKITPEQLMAENRTVDVVEYSRNYKNKK
ncbi:MAG: YidC/Oxa1 family membrane protein insertase [Clostridia bacterium]|nr:YidC/Oxa1 family membrane protein insertase [Clostridia bacterium]